MPRKHITSKALKRLMDKAEGDWDFLIYLLKDYFTKEIK